MKVDTILANKRKQDESDKQETLNDQNSLKAWIPICLMNQCLSELSQKFEKLKNLGKASREIIKKLPKSEQKLLNIAQKTIFHH